MTASKLPDDLEIAPDYTVGYWKSLQLDLDVPHSDDWEKAIEVLDARIRRRFLEPVDELIKLDQGQPKKTFGFAILAIDFLVIETLQGFRDGILNHNAKSRELFTKFLVQWDAFKDCVPPAGDPDSLAKQVYRDYRCTLHHSGATEGALRVGISGPMLAFKSDHEVKINRTCLHKHLKHQFEKYLADLLMPENKALRCNFKRKMNTVCGL